LKRRAEDQREGSVWPTGTRYILLIILIKKRSKSVNGSKDMARRRNGRTQSEHCATKLFPDTFQHQSNSASHDGLKRHKRFVIFLRGVFTFSVSSGSLLDLLETLSSLLSCSESIFSAADPIANEVWDKRKAASVTGQMFQH